MTRVTFSLADRPDGTLPTVVESGFDQRIAARRAKAYETNKQGWAAQMTLIAK